MAKPTTECFGKITMKCIPKDVYGFIVDKQGEFKKQRTVNTPISMETTIIRILKTHPEFKK